ncbi:MAG: ATP-dependent sacrificial sulfur transferase LarE [bacterium]|nr:ATP-dependent sacrificial sulfur transferase LarE [bacterium]
MKLYTRLREVIQPFSSVLVAYSGGIDSALVAKVAFDVLKEKAVALTALSPSFPSYQLEETKKVAAWIGIRHLLVQSNELDDPDYAANPTNRCYFCKSELYSLCEKKAAEWNIPVILNGFNKEDQGDWRPGFQAQKEYKVVSPLLEAGLGKEEVRKTAQALGLPIWDKPASPCLSSRFPYGTAIDAEKLEQVDRVESFLYTQGFRIFRARFYGEEVRLDLGEKETGFIQDKNIYQKVNETCLEAGFKKMTINPEGFRSGSLNTFL